jgi:hypothetical protein
LPTNVVITAESITPLARDIARLIFYDEGVGTGEREKVRGGSEPDLSGTSASHPPQSIAIIRRDLGSHRSARQDDAGIEPATIIRVLTL